MDLYAKLFDRATGFRVSEDDGFGGPEITLERRGQLEGPDLWTIKLNSFCLSRDGKLEYEPLPSSREDDFLERCRYTLDQAVELCDQYDLWSAKWQQGSGFVSDKFNYTQAHPSAAKDSSS